MHGSHLTPRTYRRAGVTHRTEPRQMRISHLTPLVSPFGDQRLGELTSLEKLHLNGCSSLVSLPERIGELKSLTSLDLRACKSLVSLPEGLGGLTNLGELGTFGCPAAESMPVALQEQPRAQECVAVHYTACRLDSLE